MVGGPLVGWIKICGITREADLPWLIDAEIDALGFNIWPASPRSVPLERAAALIERARDLGFEGECALVAVLEKTEDWDALCRAVRTCRADWIQVHSRGGSLAPIPGENDPTAVPALLGRAGSAIASHAAWAKRVLVDGDSGAAVGGTGARADWGQVAAWVETYPDLQIVLAGGLNDLNVAEAIQHTRAWGVDVASGVETAPGIKSRTKVDAFVQMARAAYSSIVGAGDAGEA